MFHMIKALSGVKPTLEAIWKVFHGRLVWHLGGIMSGDCIMDIRHVFLIRYLGPLNSKHTSYVSFSVTPNPIFSNFVGVPSLEYNAAIFNECYPRIENWNYPTKMYTLLWWVCCSFSVPRPSALEGYFPLLLLYHHTASSSIRCVAL